LTASNQVDKLQLGSQFPHWGRHRVDRIGEKAVLKQYLLILALLSVIGCVDDQDPVQPTVWSSQSLHSGLQISFPEGYEGKGLWCGMDACWFYKNRADDLAIFHIPAFGMTGGLPEHFDTLPTQYLYPDAQIMTTDSGLQAAFYSERDGGPFGDICRGTFFVAENDGSGFVEAVRVSFAPAWRNQVLAVLQTIAY